MIVASLLLATTAALPPVIADPRRGPSAWQVVASDAPVPASGAAGYILELPAPPAGPGQRWLETAVALAGRGVPVIAIGAVPPPAAVLPYLDGFAPEPSPLPEAEADLLAALGGVPLVVAAVDAAGAVAALSAGAAAVLVPSPDPSWALELGDLLPEPQPARSGDRELPTAMRAADLATVVGLPASYPGGEVVLSGGWHAGARLLSGGSSPLALQRRGEREVTLLPPLARGGILVVARPDDARRAFENVAVSGERLPSAAEVLARHQRAAAREDRLVPRWQAEQALLIRVWVAELSRSFEVRLAGPAFWERGIGSDWEITKAWVDGVVWNPDRMPDLPLLEPQRPPVPPLALRLEPSYRYELAAVQEREGRRCFALAFSGARPGGETRRGTAYIDASTFGLVELDESADGLRGEVRATRSVTTYHRMETSGEAVWLPEKVTADDLLAAFGGTATVHRELRLSAFRLDPPAFATGRSSSYAGPHRMLRDAPSGVVPLVPDGRGGRVPGGNVRPAQRFLIAGAAYDPGLSYPVPFGGLQIQDFDFRHRGEQLRLLAAGVVNDAAWSARHGRAELSARAFVQLLPFSNTRYRRGREEDAESVKVQRQSVGGGVATTVGAVRVLLDLGVNRWDFSRDDHAATTFVRPSSTFEGVMKVQGEAALGPVTASLAGEAGSREDWRAWGLDGSETPHRSWQRARLLVVYEKALFPLAKLHLDAEGWAGRDLDRFSAPSPSRFGGVHIRGIASDRVLPEKLGVVRASLALPLSPSVRGEVGVDVGWVHDIDGVYRARPLSGAGLGLTVPGPWGTLVQGGVGMPLATPGPRRPTMELFILRPLAHR